MTLREALAMGIARLQEAGIEGAARDVRALLAEAAGIEPSKVLLEGAMELPDAALYEALLERRAGGEPVSKIIGRRQFWGREFTVTRETLDPRPETETLIAAALELGPVVRFADLGTGSGIIAISLLCEWPEATALATDASAGALAVAKQNAETHGVQAGLSLRHIQTEGEWLPEGVGRFDMILSNPPYISEEEMAGLSREVFDHDPHLALTPGGDGLAPYRVIARDAPAALSPDGVVLVEIGWRQGAAVAALFEEAGFGEVTCLPDLDGRDRVIVAKKPPLGA